MTLLGLDDIPKLRFVSEKEMYMIGDVVVKHGHEGLHGARVGFNTLAKVYNHYVQGHVHSAAVFRNAACAGSTADLDMDYNIGANAWIHANVLIQPDSSLQVLSIMQNGVWKN